MTMIMMMMMMMIRTIISQFIAVRASTTLACQLNVIQPDQSMSLTVFYPPPVLP